MLFFYSTIRYSIQFINNQNTEPPIGEYILQERKEKKEIGTNSISRQSGVKQEECPRRFLVLVIERRNIYILNNKKEVTSFFLLSCVITLFSFVQVV